MNNETLSLNSELKYFKEDILKDIKSTVNKLDSKYDSQKDVFLNKISHIESRLEALFTKVLTLSSSISSDKSASEKIISLDKFRAKTQDTLFVLESNFKSQSKLIKETSYRLDSFINENIYYNGIIGPTANCKFPTFHNFIDFIISNISQLNIFKEKTINLDFKGYKNKIDNMIEMIKIELENNSKTNNSLTKQSIKECEEKFKNLLNINEEKIMEVRIENNKFIYNLETNFDNMNNKLKIFKKDIYEKLENKKEEINKIYKYIDDKIEIYHRECLENYEQLKRLNEEQNIPKERKKDNRHFTVRNSAKSFLKKYIEGKVGVEEVSHHKNIYNINKSNNLNENNCDGKNNLLDLNNNNNNVNNILGKTLFSEKHLLLKDYFNNINNNLTNEKNDNYTINKPYMGNYKFKSINKISSKNLYKTDFESNKNNSLLNNNNINDKQISSNNNLKLSTFINYKNEENTLKSNSNFQKIKTKEKDKKIKESKSDIELFKENDFKKIKKKKSLINKENLLKNNYTNSLSTEKYSIYNNSTNNNIYNLTSKMKNEMIDTTADNPHNNNKININKNDITKIIVKSLISGHNSLPKLSLLNKDINNNDDYPYTISSVVNIKNISPSKYQKENKDISSYLFNKNNNNIDSKSKIQSPSLNKSNKKENNNIYNDNMINILNYSENNTLKIKKSNEHDLSEKKESNSSNKNLIHSKSYRNGVMKNKEKDIFQNKIIKKSYSKNKNKENNKDKDKLFDKDNLFFYDSFSNDKFGIIAKNQIETSLKHIGIYPNNANINNKDLFSISYKSKSNFGTYSPNSIEKKIKLI